ncbi:Hypothetical protein P9303_09221 [Prochlorococcus marinus str. MIT 9303]|uniref:Uncharacterized protein n=1 Tax=Prochlorococcus marinus (strain MIT 9303) TaxID=59922 RepID=A2C863_PROM3|nr:Hypothetical protein P9303_09221 [Prochlorococcus marinus str. MIT 9303]
MGSSIKSNQPIKQSLGRHISSFAQHTHNLTIVEKLAKPENDLSSSVLPC